MSGFSSLAAARGAAPGGFGADAEAVRRIEMQDRCVYLVSRPAALALEATTCCNLRCIMCPLREEPAGPEWRGRHMSQEVFDAAAVGFPDAIVFFGGLGEPFMHPRFPAMLERAARESRGVSLVSNATLWTREICEMLVELKVERVMVSIDARDPALYEKIRGAPLERTLRNVRMLMETRRRSGARRPSLGVNLTMMRCNAQEMPAVAELAAELGADEVSYGHMYQGYAAAKRPEFLREQSLDYADPAVEGWIARARAAAARRGIRAEFPDVSAILAKYQTLSPLLTEEMRTEEAMSPRIADRRESAAVKKILAEVEERLRAEGRTEQAITTLHEAVLSKPMAEVQQDLFAATRQAAPDFAASPAPPRRLPLCDDAFRALFIAQNGDTYLNCEAYHIRTDLLGNLKEQTLSEIWNGAPLRELRRWWYALDGRETTDVQ